MAAKRTSHKTRNLIIAVLPLLAALICLGIGRYSLSVRETVKILFSHFTGYEPDPTGYTVIFNVRLPRILLAILVGAGLSCAGAAFQGLFSNPLATPDTLGVASGASFGAVLGFCAWKPDPGSDAGPDLWNHLLYYHLFHQPKKRKEQHRHDCPGRNGDLRGL